jgi:hypothetical protein
MRIRFSVILSAGILAIVMVEAQGIGTRHIPFGKARPIIEQLRPGDRVVTLDSPKISDGLEKQLVSVDEALNELLIMPEVVVFRVERSESYLVENGTWVRTRVSAHVENAVRHSAPIPWGDEPNRLMLEASAIDTLEHPEPALRRIPRATGGSPFSARRCRVLISATARQRHCPCRRSKAE